MNGSSLTLIFCVKGPRAISPLPNTTEPSILSHPMKCLPQRMKAKLGILSLLVQTDRSGNYTLQKIPFTLPLMKVFSDLTMLEIRG